MANTQIPQLSQYQFGLLRHTAKAPVPIFLLPRPVKDDSHSQRFKLLSRRNEVRSLVGMGLLEDATEEFEESVQEHVAKSGRKVKVFGLTEIGYHLFKDCDSRAIN